VIPGSTAEEYFRRIGCEIFQFEKLEANINLEKKDAEEGDLPMGVQRGQQPIVSRRTRLLAKRPQKPWLKNLPLLP
jgi:hypothetical protein